MAGSSPKSEPKPKRAPTLYFIVLHHLGKGFLLLLASGAIFELSGHDLGGIWNQFLSFLHVDPAHKLFTEIGEQLTAVTPASMRKAEMGTFLYGCVLTAAGIGLAFRAHWGVWLAIGESAFFIPIEIYEIMRHLSPDHVVTPHPNMFHHPVIALFSVLVINLIIVIYLFRNRDRIFRHH